MTIELEPPPAWAIDIAKIALLQGSSNGRRAATMCIEPGSVQLLEGAFIAACGGSAIKVSPCRRFVEIVTPRYVLEACCNDIQRAVIRYILAESSL